MRRMGLGAAFRMPGHSIPMYFETLFRHFPAYLRLAFILCVPTILLLPISLFAKSLPLEVEGGLYLSIVILGTLTALLGPYLYLDMMINHRIGIDKPVLSLIKDLGRRGVINILSLLILIHFLGLLPFLVVSAGLAVQIQFFFTAETQAVLILSWILALFCSLFFCFSWSLLSGFTAHMQYFIREVSLRPLKASFLIWRYRLFGIVLLYLCLIFINMAMAVAFMIPGYLEGLVFGLSDAVSQQSEDGMVQLAQSMKSGTSSEEMFTGQIKTFVEGFRPGITSTVSAVFHFCFSCTFLCFHTLYLMGFYHSEEWFYPQELRS